MGKPCWCSQVVIAMMTQNNIPQAHNARNQYQIYEWSTPIDQHVEVGYKYLCAWDLPQMQVGLSPILPGTRVTNTACQSFQFKFSDGAPELQVLHMKLHTNKDPQDYIVNISCTCKVLGQTPFTSLRM